MEYNMPPNEDDKERVTPQGPRMLPPDWRSAPPFWDNFVGVLNGIRNLKDGPVAKNIGCSSLCILLLCGLFPL